MNFDLTPRQVKVQQVLQRIEDVQAMCAKRRQSLKNFIEKPPRPVQAVHPEPVNHHLSNSSSAPQILSDNDRRKSLSAHEKVSYYEYDYIIRQNFNPPRRLITHLVPVLEPQLYVHASAYNLSRAGSPVKTREGGRQPMALTPTPLQPWLTFVMRTHCSRNAGNYALICISTSILIPKSFFASVFNNILDISAEL